jgi:hypothetical protein
VGGGACLAAILKARRQRALDWALILVMIFRVLAGRTGILGCSSVLLHAVRGAVDGQQQQVIGGLRGWRTIKLPSWAVDRAFSVEMRVDDGNLGRRPSGASGPPLDPT